MDNNVYRCVECQAEVIVKNGNIIVRKCEHDGKGVTADVSATVYGESSLK